MNWETASLWKNLMVVLGLVVGIILIDGGNISIYLSIELYGTRRWMNRNWRVYFMFLRPPRERRDVEVGGGGIWWFGPVYTYINKPTNKNVYFSTKQFSV